MEWFKQYSSNTLGGSGNHSVFFIDDDDEHKGRVYYKIFSGGTYQYSLLFSNIVDGTYEEGQESRCNKVCDEWELIQVNVGVCDTCDENTAVTPEKMQRLTFDGKESKRVMPGEFFTSDAMEFTAKKDQYLCVEVVFRGSMIPNHEQSILPAFVWEAGQWVPSRNFPFPGMIGCDRKVKGKIGFLGDSITQGIGTPRNAYTHWCALTAEAVGDDFSYWNLGLGFGRAQDAASDGAWMFKAKQMNGIVLCFGTNDIGKNRTEEELKEDLSTIICKLKESGVKILLQTLPPFGWEDKKLETWIHVNQYIRETLAAEVDAVFDIAPLLTDGPELEGKLKYCDHPNEEGCRIWSEALVPVLKDFLQKIG